MEIDLAHNALNIIRANTGQPAHWLELDPHNNKNAVDGRLEFQIGQDKVPFFAEIKNEVKGYELVQILRQAKTHDPLIVIALRIFPKMKEALRQNEIAYVEANGNFFLKHGNTHIWIDGNKTLAADQEKTNRAFTRTGLKVIFELFLDETLINQPYRHIAEKMKIGLGNLNYIVNGLKEEGFLIMMGKRNHRLIDKRRLLEKWMVAYAQKLKPALRIGKFRFLKPEDFTHWRNVNLLAMKTWWGGEPAGDLLTNYLKPAILTLYTIETREDLIRHYRLIPDDNGQVEVFQRFWVNDLFNDNWVPPILVYTDLMNTGDARCIETAKKVFDECLANQF